MVAKLLKINDTPKHDTYLLFVVFQNGQRDMVSQCQDAR